MTGRFISLPPHARVYIGGVMACGLLAIGHSLYVLYSVPVPSQWFLLAALTLLSGSITIKLPSIPATLSVSETFVFTSVLLFGTAAGTIIVTLDGLIISLWLQRKNPELHKLLFNTTAPALSIWIAAQLFFSITGVAPLSVRTSSIAALLPGLFVFASAYFLLNSWLMAIAVGIEKRLSPFKVWRQNFLWVSLSFFSGASLAILLVSLNHEVNFTALAVIVPLLIISYLTHHTSMGRVEDANKHVDELNRLYLSTIETLAMAIDAKDQVTHGHIRRVQAYSVFLAKHLGVKDRKLLKAMEAASLLHDMGKLAIPEHILNKAGKLSTAEFEIMKLHSSIGADILAAIAFPFPVAPIVRHHHEHWDGSGYPDGLAGTDIPIGARILSVVDCFDAVTSDRPYRSKLSDDAALAILKTRRGSMYDPLVVDAMLEIHGSAVIPVERPPVETVILTARMKLGKVLANASKDGAADEAVFNPATTPNGQIAPYSVEVMASYIAKLASGSLLVLYAIDRAASTLCVVGAWGREAAIAKRLRIPFGGGVSGSVASTSRAIYRADASLDFADDMQLPVVTFGTCSATPVVAGEHIIGVLTIYLSETAPTLCMEDRSFESAGAHFSTYLSTIHRRC